LPTLESMQCGNPIIAPKTGGQTRQVVDHRDGTENGVALPIEMQTLVGSQGVPFIYEDYVTQQTVADAIYKLYKMPKQERYELGQKAKRYVQDEFGYQKTVDLWHESLLDVIDTWKQKYTRWSCEEL
jgi:glycosyltransferase involved in cell wall biosynthesis